MISADVNSHIKQNKNKRSGGFILQGSLEVSSKLEIQCKKSTYLLFGFRYSTGNDIGIPSMTHHHLNPMPMAFHHLDIAC